MPKIKSEKQKNISIFPIIGILLIGCSSGSVTTEINTKKNPVVSNPKEYQSSLNAIEKFSAIKNHYSDKNLKSMANGALDALIKQQNLIAQQLRTTDQLLLRPGYSYEFDLESFCVNAGVERPVQGDGLFLGDIEGAPKSWLPQILNNYKKKGISQEDVQVLIWSLLSGARFDELNLENRNNLIKIFPDAASRFGNSFIEDSAQGFLISQMPAEVSTVKDSFDHYNSLLQSTQVSFSEIEKILSPQSSRKNAIPVGWLKHEDGYYIQLKSDGYQRVHVQIYAPENLKLETYFKPSKHIVLPGQGQRLALSGTVINKHADSGSQGFKNLSGISLREAAFIVKHPMDAYLIYQAAQQALLATSNNLKSSHHFEDDKADAFRHFVWSGLVAHEIGYDKAKEYLDAHEEFPKNNQEAKNMDLLNNSKGLAYGKSYHGSDIKQDIVQEGLKKVKNKELKWIK